MKTEKLVHIPFAEHKEVECVYQTMSIQQISSLWKREKMIVEYYQRQNTAWSANQKKLLIDSLQKGYGIPALIINKNSNGQYIVIDGQQRITSILDYMSDKFKFNGCYYKEILPEDQLDFMSLNLDVALYLGDMSDELKREIYKRCQNGSKHNSSEILKASGSAIVPDIIDSLSRISYLKSHANKLKRDTDHKVYAQVYMLEEGISNNNTTTNFDSNYIAKLYEENKESGLDKTLKKRVEEIFDSMNNVLGDKAIKFTNMETMVFYQAVRNNYKHIKNLKHISNDKVDSMIKFLKTDSEEHFQATNKWVRTPSTMTPLVNTVSDILFK